MSAAGHQFLDRASAAMRTTPHEPYRVTWGASLSETFATFPEALALYNDILASGWRGGVTVTNDDRSDEDSTGLTEEEREQL